MLNGITESRLLSRRQFLLGAGGVAGLATIGGGAVVVTQLTGGGRGVRMMSSLAPSEAGPVHGFLTRPDLRPPSVSVTAAGSAQGYLFLTPRPHTPSQTGPLLVDDAGQPVWFSPSTPHLGATNLAKRIYQGRPVLTWWEGKPAGRYHEGEGVVVDDSYQEVTRVRAANGRSLDMHEFLLTPDGTALFTCTPKLVPFDLSSIGGEKDGHVFESTIQEVDVRTGRLIFEWRSLAHIAPSESYVVPDPNYDYLHVNSIDVAPDGNLLISARHTCALYKLDRRTGRVIWRLGGKRSDFQLGKGADFRWQHDARQLTDRTLTVFDDGAGPDGVELPGEGQSRALVLDVDTSRKTVRLKRAYRHHRPLLARAMGSVQMLPDGHVLVGWGTAPYASEFQADGTLVADADLGAHHASYRAFRYPWTAAPAERPVIISRRNVHTDASTLYVSWNGATAVTYWHVRAGRRATDLRSVGLAMPRGFETAIPLGRADGFVAVTALDAARRSLADSQVIRL